MLTGPLKLNCRAGTGSRTPRSLGTSQDYIIAIIVIIIIIVIVIVIILMIVIVIVIIIIVYIYMWTRMKKKG